MLTSLDLGMNYMSSFFLCRGAHTGGDMGIKNCFSFLIQIHTAGYRNKSMVV
jgi:hypothetical protein